MNNRIFTLSFTPIELAFVASRLNAPSLVLMEDPFDGWANEQIADALQQAQDSLVEHQYIQVQPEGGLAIDTTVAGLVGTLAFTESALVVTRVRENDAQPSVRRIHYAAGLIVEQEQQPDETFVLTAVQDQAILGQRLKEFLGLDAQPMPFSQPYILPESSVSDVPYVIAADGKQAGVTFLEQAGASFDFASALARALAHPRCQSTLRALVWQAGETQLAGHLTVLEEIYGLWLFQPQQQDGEPQVNIVPCDAAHVVEQIEALVDCIIPIIEE